MTDSLLQLWHAITGIPHLKAYLTAAYVVYLVWVSFLIVLQKREPVATLSWVLSLAALPYIGFIVFFVMGPQKIVRQRLRRGRARSGMDDYSSVCPPDKDCTEVARLGQATTGLPPSSAVTADLLVDGAATYRAMVEAIAAACDHVHMEYYIFTPDHSGTLVRDALVERAAAGIKVRLLLDAMGSMSTGKSFLKPLLDAGAEFSWFHPTRLRPFTRPWLNLRTHRKILVVDGRVGFAGGINVTDEENEEVDRNAYRDLHYRVSGPVVRSLQLVFLEDWIYATGHGRAQLAGNDLFPADVAEAKGAIEAQVVVSGPDSSWEAIHRLQVEAIHDADRRVWLVTPYFVPGEAARMALTSSALAGLDVRLLVPKQSDSRLVTYAARSYFDELLVAGVKVYEYGPRMLHTKALLVDDDLAMVGSANFDHRSFRLNFEVAMLFRDAGTAATLSALLEGEFDAATRVHDARARALWRHRVPEAFARLLSPLL